MRKLYFFALALVGFAGQSQIINFPDDNFKAKLLQPGVAQGEFGNDLTLDSNGDGEIQISEAQLAYSLDVSNGGISDLTGISNFTGLKGLDCSNNLLTGLFIDDAIALYFMDASHNALTAVDINFSSFIGIGLDLSYNNLASFTIENAEYYDSINLSHNQLTNLVVESANIDYLSLDYNNLSSIQTIGNVAIGFTAGFGNNQFSLLDLTGFTFGNETTVYFGNNTVDRVLFGDQPGNIVYTSNNTFADFGNFRTVTSCQPEHQGSLTIADCPNLEYFILKNGFNHTVVTCDEGGTIFDNPALDLNVSNCPSLFFVCVDEGEKSNIQSSINYLGLQNQVEVNSYCTFTPGGSYYTVDGSTKADLNANGCDSSDFSVPYQKFTITSGSNSGTIVSDDSGNHAINVGPGAHTITPIIENPAYFEISPASIVANFPSMASPFTQDFCITPAGSFNDLEIVLTPATVARPEFDSEYIVSCRNKGTTTQNALVSFVFDDNLSDVVSTNPTATQTTNSVSWNFDDLQPLETRSARVILNLNSPTETPAVNAGDVLQFSASANAATDETPQDNTAALNQAVVNSFDPNDKTCLEGNVVTPDILGQFVHYVIRFENTGTANAVNIVVKDMIDTAKFDISTLIPLHGSHSFTTRISESNKVEFIFENINLPFDDANNDGYVAFKIKTKPTLQVGDAFSNTASIYFDYNFPIVTNTATTTIQLLGNPDFEFGDAFTLYPNPAHDVLNLQSKNGVEAKSVGIYNMLGQLVRVETGNVSAFDISALQTGNYFIKVYSARGNAVSKFVKQ